MTSSLSKSLPKISVVMPVLNRADTIEKALQSVVNQQYPSLELIIIDGGSTDGTVDIIKQYLAHIHYWQSQPDGNPTNAMNIGIEKTSGDLIAILMADDWYEEGLFAQLAAAYQANPKADMFTCGGAIVSVDVKTKSYRTERKYSTAKEMAVTINNICFADISAICCRFIKKSLYERLGVYFPFDMHGKYLFSNDKEFLLRVALENVNNVHLPLIGHYYLAHSGSSTFGNNHANTIRMCREHMLIAEQYLQTKNLTWWQRGQFIYWYNDQASRLIAYHMLDGEFKKMWQVMGEVGRKYTFILPLSSLLTTLRLARKKVLKKCKPSV